MVLFSHYCSRGFSNCYLLGNDAAAAGSRKKEMLIIDPPQIDEAIIDFIEKNNYVLKAALLTHDHANHSYGLRALLRIYENVAIYAANPEVQGFKTTIVRGVESFRAAGLKIEVFSTPGHSADSVCYRAGHLLFSGDTLTSGLIGSTASNYAARAEVSALQNKILSLPGNLLIFPAHGPPSTLETEIHFNIGLHRHYEQNMRRSANRDFNLDLLE